MNLIQKLHALMVSDKVNVWHFPNKKEGPKFYFWVEGEEGHQDGHGWYTLDKMIEEAYKHIDPLLQQLPPECPVPPAVQEHGEEMFDINPS